MSAPAHLTLVIANKNYSSWSARPWLTMTELGIPFTEHMVKFDSADWAESITKLSPSRLVPVLWEGEAGHGLATFDTIAILERLHELFPQVDVWPREARARARARSLVADFHAGYRILRDAMPMNIRSRYPGKGMTPQVAAENRPSVRSLEGHEGAIRRGWAVPVRSLLRRRRLLRAGGFALRDLRRQAFRRRATLPGSLARHRSHAHMDGGGA